MGYGHTFSLLVFLLAPNQHGAFPIPNDNNHHTRCNGKCQEFAFSKETRSHYLPRFVHKKTSFQTSPLKCFGWFSSPIHLFPTALDISPRPSLDHSIRSQQEHQRSLQYISHSLVLLWGNQQSLSHPL